MRRVGAGVGRDQRQLRGPERPLQGDGPGPVGRMGSVCLQLKETGGVAHAAHWLVRDGRRLVAESEAERWQLLSQSGV